MNEKHTHTKKKKTEQKNTKKKDRKEQGETGAIAKGQS